MGDPNTIALASFWIAASGGFLLYVSNGLLAPLSLALGIAGTACAWIGRQRIKRGESTKHSMWAEVGLAVGGCCVGFSLIALVILILAFVLD